MSLVGSPTKRLADAVGRPAFSADSPAFDHEFVIQSYLRNKLKD
jgi:hypothetical protein